MKASVGAIDPKTGISETADVTWKKFVMKEVKTSLSIERIIIFLWSSENQF
jgi:hypothetical protein